MSWVYGVPVAVATFVLMEAVAWATHRWVMHGALWPVHQDHHQQRGTIFQRNDLFALVFAIPSWLCIMFGMMAGGDARMWIGFGILAYGLAYTLVHEWVIHRRFPSAPRWDHWYVRAIRRAHQVHHSRLTKDGCESFGMLLVAPRYYREQRRLLRERAGRGADREAGTC